MAILIEQVATWLRDVLRDPAIPGGRAIAAEYDRFRADVPTIRALKRLGYGSTGCTVDLFRK